MVRGYSIIFGASKGGVNQDTANHTFSRQTQCGNQGGEVWLSVPSSLHKNTMKIEYSHELSMEAARHL